MAPAWVRTVEEKTSETEETKMSSTIPPLLVGELVTTGGVPAILQSTSGACAKTIPSQPKCTESELKEDRSMDRLRTPKSVAYRPSFDSGEKAAHRYADQNAEDRGDDED